MRHKMGMEVDMPKFLIEREVPGLGGLKAAEMQAMARKSCDVLRSMPRVQWQESFVTADKMYWV